VVSWSRTGAASSCWPASSPVDSRSWPRPVELTVLYLGGNFDSAFGTPANPAAVSLTNWIVVTAQ
jgi:hypothetical protein